MQILNDDWVDYCNVSSNLSGELKYLPGISFNNKLFIKRKLFSLDEKSKAIEYCKQKYLEAKGATSYVLVEYTTGLIVWIEDKSAKVIGNEDPVDIINTIDLEDLVSQMRSIDGIKIKDRKYNFRIYKQCFVGEEACQYLIEKLEISIEQAINLGQKLIDEKWIHHVADDQPFNNGYFFYRFYRDEE